MEDCIVYLVWQLRQASFQVKFTWPNLLFISWRHHEGNYLANKNPIVQAMMPEPVAPPKPATGSSQKKKEPNYQPPRPTSNYMEEIDLITRGSSSSYASPPGQGQGQAQRVQVSKQAMDYQPPASFVQNLERPGPGREQKEGVIKGNVLADLWSM